MNKLFFSLALTLISFYPVTAQTGKYQGLLWEITGNGLKEPSYLYGTMHVSNKLAFNVSDSFYICLSNVDAVALESSPDTWMEDYRNMASFSSFSYGSGSADFYKEAFKIKHPGIKEVYLLLRNNNSLMNQILYRFNPGFEDYQEDTFLDMFIFQAGKKNNKPCYSLEKIDEVIELTIRAMVPDEEEEKSGSNSYLEEEYQNKSDLLEDYYRRGDLDKLDSLNKAESVSKNYHKYFIIERNRNMVRRMDSLMQIQSLFTGIGASHLPGDEGAIELLRELGYTVRAVSPKSTGKSHKMRKKFNKLYKPVPFNPQSTDDGFVTVSVPGNLYGMDTYTRGRLEYLSPEPINGGYFSVQRLFTYGPLFNKSPEYFKATFDSVIYEATPGDIVKQTEIELNGYSGYQILTKTSKNAYAHYKVFFTPTEVIMFKGSGNGKYIKRSEPSIFFNSIALKPSSSEWSEVSPKYGGAKWKMKGLVTGQDIIDELDDQSVDPLYQSYDAANDAYFLTMRYTNNDLEYIEEDSFDLAFLGESFGKELGYEVYSSELGLKDKKPFVDQVLKPERPDKSKREALRTRIIAKGGFYYFMLTTADQNLASEFFNSFEFTGYSLDEEYVKVVDSTMSFKVSTYEENKNAELFNMAMKLYAKNKKKEDNTDFESKFKKRTFTSPFTGEIIYVEYQKFNDYDAAISDSDFWAYRTKLLTKDNGFIVSRKEVGISGDDKTVSFLLSDTGSTRGILTKMQLHHGVLYTVQSLIDTNSGPSPYVQEFFNTFEPLDTLIGRTIFENKADVFFDHANGEDSLNKVNAMKSINMIDFEEKDVPRIIEMYNTYEFDEDDETDHRKDLIMALGGLEAVEMYPFLKKVFLENDYESEIQFTVLRALSYTETQEAYDLVFELLTKHTPLTDKSGKMNFFGYLEDSLELSVNYFPDLLNLMSYPEFKPRVVEMLAVGFMDSIYTTTNYKSEKEKLLNEAKIELKRTIADQGKDDKDENKYSYFSYTDIDSPYESTLLDYYILMSGLKKDGDTDVEEFFKGIEKITDKKFIVETQIINHKLGFPVDKEKITDACQDIKYRVWVYNRLADNDMSDYFDSTLTQEDLAMGLLYNSNYDEEEDTVVFVKKILVDDGKHTGHIYFFKRKTEDSKNWMIDYVGIQPNDEGEFQPHNQLKKKGLTIKNDEELDKTIEKSIEKFEYRYRKRVVLIDYNYWSNLFGFEY